MTRRASQIATQSGKSPDSLTLSEADEESISIDDVALAKLIAFFRLLDKWDLDAQHDAEIM